MKASYLLFMYGIINKENCAQKIWHKKDTFYLSLFESLCLRYLQFLFDIQHIDTET